MSALPGLAASALLIGFVATGFSQQKLELEIVSPVAGAYVSDHLMLEARILPRERRNEVTDITFFADGKLICRSTNSQLPRCSWDAGPLVREHVIRVVAATVSGERLVATTRTRKVDVNESVNVQVVQVNASVVDRSGKFVNGLTRDQFRLLEDGRPQNILHLAAEEAPLEIVLAMDISASMGPAIHDLKMAVRQFLARLKPTDHVTLVAFNQDMFVLTRRETSPAARDKAVDRLSAWGGTTLYDVIIRSIELVSRQPGRRSLVVFSDGEDQSSQASLETVDRAVKASDASLFMVALGRGRENKALQETLVSLAEPSGGRALFADRAADLGDTFSQLLDELKHQYLVGYESTNTKRDGTWRRLEVDVPGSRHRVRARQGYFGPTP